MARILLVDDEEDVLETLRVLLKNDGHRILPVREGFAAMELIKSLEKIDLLVVDLRMAPVDGIELIQVARDLRPELGIVVVSAYLDDETIQKVETLGCTAYIKKPFSIEEILDVVRDALSQTHATSAGDQA